MLSSFYDDNKNMDAADYLPDFYEDWVRLVLEDEATAMEVTNYASWEKVVHHLQNA